MKVDDLERSLLSSFKSLGKVSSVAKAMEDPPKPLVFPGAKDGQQKT